MIRELTAFFTWSQNLVCFPQYILLIEIQIHFIVLDGFCIKPPILRSGSSIECGENMHVQLELLLGPFWIKLRHCPPLSGPNAGVASIMHASSLPLVLQLQSQ